MVVYSAEIIPVGTAIVAYPRIIANDATSCPNSVRGDISPYPTVVMVTIAQYMLRGMLVNPLASPSIKYIIEPMMVHSVNMKNKNTIIFRRDDIRASIRRFASPI